MSWLLPGRLHAEDRAKLDALVAESVSERERAVEVATAVALQTGADQRRLDATISGIRHRIALQQQRAVARQATTTADGRARRILGDLLTDVGGKVTL